VCDVDYTLEGQEAAVKTSLFGKTRKKDQEDREQGRDRLRRGLGNEAVSVCGKGLLASHGIKQLEAVFNL